MCDYSLEHYATVDAKQGGVYLLRTLATGSNGFITSGSVVCMKEGALLRLEGIDSSIAHALGIDGAQDVIFSKLRAPEGYRGHRDAVTFKNGTQLSLQCLNSGCWATVLMPPASTKEDRDLVSSEPAPQRVSRRYTHSFIERMFSL